MSSSSETHGGSKPDAYARVAELLKTRDRFLLTGHVRPDGDCLGAEAALFHLLRALGKEVRIVNPDPIAERYAFLAEKTPFESWNASRPDGGIGRFDVACVLDVAAIERTGPLAARIREEKATACVLDHHQPGLDAAWDVELIDSTAPATGVLVWRLARRLEIALPKAALDAVFVSLTTDTGWFKYSNTDRETFHVASELVAGGVDPSAIFGKLYQTFKPEYPIGVGVALRSLRYEAGGRLAVVMLRNGDLAATGGELADTDDVLDILRAVEKVEVVLLFREPVPGRAKLSARSKGSVDVNRLLRPFGGGGHTRAAGADLPGPFDAAAERVIAAAVAAISQP